ncbi:hypothetical protein Tco_0206459 [Tanacetum coccineum]
MCCDDSLSRRALAGYDNHHKVAKYIWDRVKLLMQGTKLSLQERESKLYDEFDKFSFMKSETLYQYYWSFAQLINNINVINMSMRPVQVNTKFLNSLPPEWNKFVTDVKLARDLHTTNYDQLYSYLEQHEARANETCLMRERYQDPLKFVANFNQPQSHITNYHSQYNATQMLQGSLQPTINLELPLIRETRPLFKTARLPCNKFKRGKDKVMLVLAIREMLLVPGKTMQEGRQALLNAIIVKTEDLDAYDFDCDDVSNAKAVLMANLSNYGSDVISEKAQRIKPTLYDGSVISSQHVVIPVIDDEEILILEELNQLSEDFGKRFVSQQELSAEQAFWLQTSNPNIKQYDISPVRIEDPSELPKVSLVSTSLKKLKIHLSKFDTVVKKRITPDAITEGEWGFEHTKVVFLTESIPILKTLKDIFNIFDKDILNEVTEVQTVFNQMEAAVQQCSVDKQCFKIHKKELLLDND